MVQPSQRNVANVIYKASLWQANQALIGRWPLSVLAAWALFSDAQLTGSCLNISYSISYRCGVVWLMSKFSSSCVILLSVWRAWFVIAHHMQSHRATHTHKRAHPHTHTHTHWCWSRSAAAAAAVTHRVNCSAPSSLLRAAPSCNGAVFTAKARK